MDTRFQSFWPLINRIVHHALLKFRPYLNKPLLQLFRIAGWYSIHALLYHAQDAVIYRIQIRTVGWTDELGCLTVQKLDCVTSTICWCKFYWNNANNQKWVLLKMMFLHFPRYSGYICFWDTVSYLEKNISLLIIRTVEPSCDRPPPFLCNNSSTFF